MSKSFPSSESEVHIFDIEVRRAFFAQQPIGCNTPHTQLAISNYLVALHFSGKTTNFDGFVPVF